ncbi:MAG: exodeoxyribonuclease [Bacteroidota bacterium]|jgi:exodeoxyribonuclease-3
MKLISFNVNGVRAITKKTFIDDVRQMNPDILCLQETKANDQQTEEALQAFDEYFIYTSSAVRPGYSGTAVLTKTKPLSVTFGLGIEEHDQEGRSIVAEFENFILINCYVPNSGSELARLDYREKWDADLLIYLKKLEEKKPVVFCGDLNVAHKAIDLANPKSNYNKSAGFTQREINGIENLLNAGFVDTFRHFYPEEVKYSWWSARFNSRAKNVGWRIDYFLVSQSFVPQIKDAFIYNDIMGSDHCPVGIILA